MEAPEPAPPSQRARGAARRAALGVLFRAYPGRTSAMATLAVLAGILPALFAMAVGRLVDALPEAVSTGAIPAVPLAAAFGVLVGVELIGTAQSLLSTDLYRRYDGYLLGRVMGTTLRLPDLASFTDPELAASTDRAARVARYGPGELVSGLQTQWGRFATGLAATVLVATVWLPAALLCPLWLVTGRFLRSDSYRADPFWSDPLRRAEYLKRLAVLPDAAKELRIFGAVDWLIERFVGEWRRVMSQLWRARRVGPRTMGVLMPLLVAGHLVALLLAIRAASAGDLTVGAVTILAQGMLGMAALAAQEGDIWIENGAIPIPAVLEHERRTAEAAGAAGGIGTERVGRVTGQIRFEDVRFAYPGRQPIFDGFDLTIEAGRSLAIVGLNGAGKTTLVKLLTGLAVPDSGRIAIDGVDLRDLDPDQWRRRVAAIFADFVRYHLPARDNIGFGAIDAMPNAMGADDSGPNGATAIDASVLTAARRAGAGDLVAGLPAGLDTYLSRRYAGGVDLSGGQWQRIALARALMAVEHGADVLVLDEPTAQLDVRAEAEIYRRFLEITAGCTAIVISHRFSTVRRAQRIVVLDGGRIVEDGTHAELVAAGGRYARLFTVQADRYRTQGEDE